MEGSPREFYTKPFAVCHLLGSCGWCTFLPVAACNGKNSPKPRYPGFLLGLSNIKLIPLVWLTFLSIPSQCQKDTHGSKPCSHISFAYLQHWKLLKKTKAVLLGKTSHGLRMPAVVKGKGQVLKNWILHYRTKIVVQFEDFLEGKMCKWRLAVWEELVEILRSERTIPKSNRATSWDYLRLQNVGTEGVRLQVARDEPGEHSWGQNPASEATRF